jgi:geranylgeranyl diphosphate synthase, type I
MAKLEKLAEFKKKIDPEISGYLDRVIKESEEVDRGITDALRHSKKIIMSGGKRARGAFMYYGYLSAGGKELKKILKASVSIELIHSFLLIHDDIIDQDATRHGTVTTHEYYKKIGERFFKNKDSKHFGTSMAIIVGDMVAALGNQVLFESEFEPKLVIRALKRLQGIVSMTVVGQSEDIYIEYRGRATTGDILKMYEHKTAKYTFEGPLHLGAILGGAGDDFLKHLSGYAIPAGIAFQIQDDILGIFGSENKTGKPVCSDIRQGKYTILVAKAFEKADLKQKKIMANCLGNKNLSKKDVNKFRKVIIESGSLDFAKNLSLELVSKAKKELEKIRMNPEAKKFLCDIADYMIEREL